MIRVTALAAVVILLAACGSSGRSSVGAAPVAAAQMTESSDLPPPVSRDTVTAIPTVPASVGYSQRLDLARALALRFPGPADRDPSFGQFGLWAGIIVQTTWQQQSHRDRIPNWSVENFTLTVAPSIYAQGYRRGGDPVQLCTGVAYVRAAPTPFLPGLPDRATACRAWMRYFLAADSRQPAPTLQHLMWDAHTQSLIEGLTEARAHLDNLAGTTEELNFWGTWLEIVLLLENVNFPTAASTAVPARAAVMPNCSPVGSVGCELSPADLGQTLSFVSALANHPVTVDQILTLYRQLNSGPFALPVVVATDPALAQAAAAYITAAGLSPMTFFHA